MYLLHKRLIIEQHQLRRCFGQKMFSRYIADSITVLTLIMIVPMVEVMAKTPVKHTANELFSAYQERVFQIRVIDNSSGKKSAIGSGFLISGNGLFATNYHVVSDVVIEPKRYRIEYVAFDGRTGPLRIRDIDVVHDCAIVASDSIHTPAFALNLNSLQKGSRIFAMGNPLDLGMTIIEGTYSGLIEGSLYEKIHFSGSLNPGMSGGPTLDASGAVIGVNVATAGEEISFLVPVKYLQKLLDTVARRPDSATLRFTERIECELYENQERYIGKLLASEWKQDTLGRCLVPREMGNIFKCWGETQHDTSVLYTVSSVNCSNNDDIYLSSEFTTGAIEFNYHWYETTRLGSERFYRVLQRQFADAEVPNYEAKNDLEEPACNTRFVSIAGAEWKTSMCTWRYKKYRRLYDVVLKMALVNLPLQSMLIELKLLGISKTSARAFCKKFMEALACRK
jgi:serine protease Do